MFYKRYQDSICVLKLTLIVQLKYSVVVFLLEFFLSVWIKMHI